jgi:hypothetical protein
MAMKRRVTLLIVSLIAVLTLVKAADGQLGAESASSSGVSERPLYALLKASTLPSPDGVHPVFRPADANSELAREAACLLEQSYARQALVLHQHVKNYLAHQPGVDPNVAVEPTYLFLGGNGGYAELGFWLEDAQGQLIDKRTTSYVGGLFIDEGHFGGFEQIFPHELGHAILQELAGWQQMVLAAQVHQVTMVTDYFYAFNEGWGEHFQAVAVDHTANVELQALRETPLPVGEQGPYARLARELKGRCLLCPAKLSLLLWFNQRENHLRYAGVKSNLFAYQPAIPEVLVRRDDPHAALLYQAVVPPDSSATFKNGPQMLASEGLIAALFYRLINDPRLQQTYREPAFYESFLPPGHDVDWSQTSPGELFSPMENVYLKLFRVFARHVRLDGDLFGESPTIQMVKGYAMDYPDEAETLYDVFLEITQGITVEPHALQVAQDWAAGRLTTVEHQEYLRNLRQRLLADQVKVDSALEPQIWLRNPDAQVGFGVMDVYGSLPRPYHFNLNAATVVDLGTVPGINAQLARKIVQVRDERGGFNTLEDLADIPGVTPERLDRFRSMQQAMHTWIDQGASSVEDELEIGLMIRSLVWSLVRRLLVELTVALTVAGLIFAAGSFLQTTSAAYLSLAAGPTEQVRAGGKVRRIIRRVGWVCVAVLLPVTLFYLGQILLLNGSQQVPTFAFAIVVWLLVLPGLGWRLVRHRLSGRTVLHRAVWALLTYVTMFNTVGWLMGI